MDKDKFSGIYCIINTVNKKCYVGQSNNVYRRRKQHFSALKAGKHENWVMQFDYNMYGSRNFIWRVIEWCPTSELNKQEKFWIKELNSFNPNGYNLTWEPYNREGEKKQSIRKEFERHKTHYKKPEVGSGVQHKKRKGQHSRSKAAAKNSCLERKLNNIGE